MPTTATERLEDLLAQKQQAAMSPAERLSGLLKEKREGLGIPIAVPREKETLYGSFGQVSESFFNEPVNWMIPLDERYRIGKIISLADDPKKEKEKFANTVYFSAVFEEEPKKIDFIAEDLKTVFGLDPSKVTSVQRGFFSKIAESWRRGDKAVIADIAAYEAIFEGRGDINQVLEIRKKLQQKQSLDPIEGNFVSELFYKSSEILPPMLKGYWQAKEEAAAGLISGAMFAAIGGQAGPQIATPEELATVPAGALLGFKFGLSAGSACYWYKQGTGAMVATMLENGYDPEVSKTIAAIAGIPYAIIEFSQVSKLTPGMRQSITKEIQKSTLKILGKAAQRYGSTLTQEVLEEIAQEIVQVGAEDLAGYLSKEGIDIDPDYLRERGQRIWETAKQATQGMALLPMPGAAIDIYTGARSIQQVEQKPEITEGKKAETVAVELPKLAETPATVGKGTPQPLAEGKREATPPVSPTETAEGKPEIDLSKLPDGTKFETKKSPAKDTTATGRPFAGKWPASESDQVILPRDPTTEERNYLQSIGYQQFWHEPTKWFSPSRIIEPPTATAEAKQPWEMTSEIYAKSQTADMRKRMGDKYINVEDGEAVAKQWHKKYVKDALSEGKPVPLNVLQEYKGEKWADEAMAKGEKKTIVESAKQWVSEKIEKITEPTDKEAAQIIHEPPGLTKAETEHLGVRPKKALRAAQARGEQVGYKAGYLQAKEEARNKIADIRNAKRITENRRESARQLVRNNLPKKEQGKFLTRATRAKTIKDLQAITDAVEKSLVELEHKEAVAELRKTIRAVKKLYGTRGTFAGKMRPEFGERVEQLLNSFKLGNIKPETKLNKDELLDMTQAVLDTTDKNSVSFVQATRIKDTLGKIKEKTFALRKLPSESIDQITDEIKMSMYENLWAEQTIAEEKARQIVDIRDKIQKAIVPKPKYVGEPKNRLDAITKGITRFLQVSHSNLESLADNMTGGKAQDVFAENIYNTIDKGVDAEYEKTFEIREQIRQILTDNGVDDEIYLSHLKEKLTVILGGKEVDITPSELMAIYMHTRHPHNLAVMLNDGFRRGKEKITGITYEEVDNLLKLVSEQQITECEQVGKEILDGTCKDAINETSVKIDGYPIATTKNYWPAARYIAKEILGKKPRGLQSTIEGLGLLKERIGIGRPLVLRGFYETLYTTTKNVSAYYGLAAPLRDVKAIMNDAKFMEYLEDNGYAEHLKDMQTQIGRVEDNAVERDPVEKFMGRLITGGVRSWFSLNPKLAPRQQISEILYAPYVDEKYLKAVRGVATKEWVDRISRISPQTRMRFEHRRFDRDIGTATLRYEPYGFFTGKSLARDKLLAWTGYHDTNAIVDGWRIAEAEIADQNPDLDKNSPEFEAKLKKRAEWLIRHTQPTWHIKDRSVLGSTPKTPTKMITMLMSQREKLVMMVNNATVAYQNGKITKKHLTKAYGTVVLNVLLIAAYNAAFYGLIYKKRRKLRDYGIDVARDLMGLVYFGRYLGLLLRLGESKIGKRYSEPGGEDLFSRFINNVIESGSDYYAAMGHFFTGERYESGPNRGKEKWQVELVRAVDGTAEVIAIYHGLPYVGPKQIVKSITNWSTEENQKRTRVRRARTRK